MATAQPLKLTRTQAKDLVEILGEFSEDLENNDVPQWQIEFVDELQTQLELAHNGALPAPVIINLREDEPDDELVTEPEDGGIEGHK